MDGSEEEAEQGGWKRRLVVRACSSGFFGEELRMNHARRTSLPLQLGTTYTYILCGCTCTSLVTMPLYIALSSPLLIRVIYSIALM